METKTREKATLTPQEVAEYLDASLTWVYNMLAEGKIPSNKIGGKYIISRKIVESLVENGSTLPITQR